MSEYRRLLIFASAVKLPALALVGFMTTHFCQLCSKIEALIHERFICSNLLDTLYFYVANYKAKFTLIASVSLALNVPLHLLHHYQRMPPIVKNAHLVALSILFTANLSNRLWRMNSQKVSCSLDTINQEYWAKEMIWKCKFTSLCHTGRKTHYRTTECEG